MLNIYQPTNADLAAINVLINRTKKHYNFTKSVSMIWSSDRKITDESLKKRIFWVGADQDGEMVFVYSIYETQEGEYRLADCWVLPEKMGKGYGRAMFDHIKVVLASIGAKQLLITAVNEMVPFYRKMNAIRIGHTIMDELDTPVHHFKLVVDP